MQVFKSLRVIPIGETEWMRHIKFDHLVERIDAKVELCGENQRKKLRKEINPCPYSMPDS